jgi:hypothetical protein
VALHLYAIVVVPGEFETFERVRRRISSFSLRTGTDIFILNISHLPVALNGSKSIVYAKI